MNELVKQDGGAVALRDSFMPVMTMDDAMQRRNVIVQATQKLMTPETDFGTIPGSKKPSLLQPGADKLCNLFGLVVQYDVVESIEDWSGKDHGGEAFFYCKVRGRAYRGDRLMGEGIGSCNSWESKYRWRNSERVCPNCGKDTIIKGKAEYGGGWICFAKKGGCGAKFQEGDPAIGEQQVGRVPNKDVYDVVNTVQKMAYKRCKVSTTINATSASEFFTQDMEDFQQPAPIDTGGHPVGTQAAANYVAEQKIAKATEEAEASIKTRLEQFAAIRAELGDKAYYSILGRNGYHHANEIKSVAKARDVYRELKQALSLGVTTEDAERIQEKQ